MERDRGIGVQRTLAVQWFSGTIDYPPQQTFTDRNQCILVNRQYRVTRAQALWPGRVA